MISIAQPTEPREARASHDSSAGLVCTGLTKSFAGVRVLNGIDITLTPGAVVGFVGENGAGKSTTSSIIAGILQADSGSMTIDGEPYDPRSPADALRAGVALIHQEIRMIPDLSVAENIYLGRLPMRAGRVDRKKLDDDAREILHLLGSEIDPRREVSGLSIAAQQEMEIARALSRQPRFIIFDEPSASLGVSETERIFEQIAVLCERGAGIVYISHRLEEIRKIADSIICLRDGSQVKTWDTGDVSRDDIVRAMVGRDFTFGHSDPAPTGVDTAIEVRNLGRTGVFQDINFSVKQGEILGIAGLIGAGRTEVVRTIAGADSCDAGQIILAGKPVRIRNPLTAIKNGIAMVPEDRKNQGLNLDRTGAENISLPWERMLASVGFISSRRVTKEANAQREFLSIRGRLDVAVSSLSGGNQQKILIGKWLVRQPKILILDEPTRGVDVGAKMKIYETIRDLAAKGVAVIVVSSELEEVIGLSHRVLVMSGGQQRGILSRETATPEAVMELALLTGPPAETDTHAPLAHTSPAHTPAR